MALCEIIDRSCPGVSLSTCKSQYRSLTSPVSPLSLSSNKRWYMFERGTLEIWKACMLDTGKSIPVCGLLSYNSIPLLHQHPTIRAAPHSAPSTLMEASLTGEAIQEYPTHTSLIMEVSIGSECNSIGAGKVSLPSVRMIMARCCTKQPL